MPTYEYTCPDGHDFEQFVLKMSLGSAQLPCPVCGKPSERQISAGGGLLFKGSGFYITDYGKDGKKDQRTSGESKATASESKPASSDAKPASSESKPSTAPAASPKSE